jgi:hypothetical protein
MAFGFGFKKGFSLAGGSNLISYLLNAIGFATKSPQQSFSGPTAYLALDHENVLRDFGGAVNADGTDVSAVPGSRLSGGVIYDDDGSSNDLHPYVMKSGVRDYQFYAPHATSTAYAVGARVWAEASDGIRRWYYIDTGDDGTSGGSAPTFPTSGTVVDGTATWTYGGKYTLRGQKIEGSLTNKCTCVKANPIDTTNLTKSGDAAATLTVVDDSTALAAAGLDGVCNGNVYKLDNSAGSAIAYAQVGGTTVNTNPHSLLMYGRVSVGTLKAVDGGSGAVWDTTTSTTYVKMGNDGFTPANTGTKLFLDASAGSVVYFILPGLYESSFAPAAPIVDPDNDTAATVSRSAVDIPIPTAGITAAEGAGRIICTPLASGQSGKVLADYTDANNWLSVDATATTITLNKRVSGTTYTAPKTITHDTDQLIVDWKYDSSGMSINAFEVGATAGSAGTDPDTTAAVLSGTTQVGASNDANHFHATYEKAMLFRNSTQATNELSDWSL